MCLSTLVQVYYWVFGNLGDIENPLTSLGVKYQPLKIRATAIAHVRVSVESETSYLFPLNVLVSWKQVKDRPARTTFLWLRRIIKCLRVNFCSNKHVFQRITSFVGIMIGGLLKLVFSRGWFSIRLYWLLIFYCHQCNTKPREWKHYVDDVFSLWDCDRKDVEFFILFIYFIYLF